jgi:hypothetical protein
MNGAAAVCNNEHRRLWVPAFAETTEPLKPTKSRFVKLMETVTKAS